MSIKFKRQCIGNCKVRYRYNILKDSKEIGEIMFAKKNKILILGYLQIYPNYCGQHNGYEVIQYILSHYKINCIVGQTLYDARGFWNKCIKKFNGQRKNIRICNNCSSSFVIPRYKISDYEMEELLEIGQEIS